MSEDRLTVRIHQAGLEVIWDCWRLIDIRTVLKEGAELGLGTFRFDPLTYAQEIAQATERANRMWPARSVAENFQAMLLPGATSRARTTDPGYAVTQRSARRGTARTWSRSATTPGTRPGSDTPCRADTTSPFLSTVLIRLFRPRPSQTDCAMRT